MEVLQTGQVKAQSCTAGKLVELDSFWIFAEESAKGLLLLHIMRVEYHCQFLETTNDIESLAFMSAHHP